MTMISYLLLLWSYFYCLFYDHELMPSISPLIWFFVWKKFSEHPFSAPSLSVCDEDDQIGHWQSVLFKHSFSLLPELSSLFHIYSCIHCLFVSILTTSFPVCIFLQFFYCFRITQNVTSSQNIYNSLITSTELGGPFIALHSVSFFFTTEYSQPSKVRAFFPLYLTLNFSSWDVWTADSLHVFWEFYDSPEFCSTGF